MRIRAQIEVNKIKIKLIFLAHGSGFLLAGHGSGTSG